MHLLRFIISYVMVTTLGLVLLAFLALNHQAVELDLLAGQYSVSLAWVMAGAALFGFVITLLLLLPGRIATAVNAWRVERDLQEMEQQYGQLQAWRARALTQHEFLLERHERMLLRYQHLVTDHRETVAELDRIRAQLAATAASRAAQAATSSVARASGAERALRLLPKTAPVVSAPLNPAPSSATRLGEQPPATHAAARAGGDTVHDAHPAQSDTQRQPRPQPAAASSASSTSSMDARPQSVATPASAPIATRPIPRRVPVVPVLTAPLAPFAVPLPAVPPAASMPPADQPTEPLVAMSAPRRTLERLLAEVRHGRQGVVELDGRLRYHVSMLRARAEAQMKAQLSRLQRRISAENIDDTDDMPGRRGRLQSGATASNDAD